MTVVVRVLALVVFVLVAGPAWSAWTPPALVNGTLVRGEPSCVGIGGGEAVCAVLSAKGAVAVSRYDGSGWSAWKALAGSVSSAPSCAEDGAGKVVCTARAVNGQLQYSVFDPVANLWTKSLKVAGSALFSGPSCARLAPGSVLCAARGATGGLTYSTFSGGIWAPFASLAASVAGRPACASGAVGQVICAVISPATYSVSVTRYASGAWSAFFPLGGVTGSDDIRCTSLESGGAIACFVQASNSVLLVNRLTGGGWPGAWTGWTQLSLGTNANGACGVTAPGQLACANIATSDGALWGVTFDGVFWGAWAKLGGLLAGTPGCAGLGNGKVACVATGVDNKAAFSVGP